MAKQQFLCGHVYSKAAQGFRSVCPPCGQRLQRERAVWPELAHAVEAGLDSGGSTIIEIARCGHPYEWTALGRYLPNWRREQVACCDDCSQREWQAEQRAAARRGSYSPGVSDYARDRGYDDFGR